MIANIELYFYASGTFFSLSRRPLIITSVENRGTAFCHGTFAFLYFDDGCRRPVCADVRVSHKGIHGQRSSAQMRLVRAFPRRHLRLAVLLLVVVPTRCTSQLVG